MEQGIYNGREVISERYGLPGCDTHRLVDIYTDVSKYLAAFVFKVTILR